MVRPYEKISHGVCDECPFRLKHDRWEAPGPGLRDMHYEVELGIVRKGRMRREFGTVTRVIEEGQIWLQGIWEPHSAEVLLAPLELYVLHITPSLLANLSFREALDVPWLLPFTMAAEKRPYGALLPGARIRHHLAALSRLDPGATGPDILALRFCALNLLLDIISHSGIGRRKGAETPFSSRIEQILGHIFEQRARVNAQDLAKRFGMSRNGFNLFFLRSMGISFARFSLRQRLSGAAGDLLASSDPVKAVSQNWGFCDVSHFHQRFRQTYGCTPAEYRKRRSKNAEL